MVWTSKAKYVTYANVPGSAALATVYDRYGNVISEAIGDAADELTNQAQKVGADLLDDVKDVAFDVANATLDVVENLGLAVISGSELMYDYGYNKISPYRVETVTALTAMTIYLITTVIIAKKIRGAS